MIRDDDGYGNGNCNDDDCDDGNDCGSDDYDDHNDDGEGDSDRGVMIQGRNCSWNKPTKCYSIAVYHILLSMNHMGTRTKLDDFICNI